MRKNPDEVIVPWGIMSECFGTIKEIGPLPSIITYFISMRVSHSIELGIKY
jgi:hypothetical protein